MFKKDGYRYPTVTGSGIYGFFRAYRFLSNFHLCPVIIDGLAFPSSENAYMACKTLDPVQKGWFVNCSPSEAKKLGRNVTLRRGWDEGLRDKEMFRVVLAKFEQNRREQGLLLATGDKYLEETNDWGDRYWGVVDGVGANGLGHTLMKARRRIYIVGDHENRI